jgi:hypothetical protein
MRILGEATIQDQEIALPLGGTWPVVVRFDPATPLSPAPPPLITTSNWSWQVVILKTALSPLAINRLPSDQSPRLLIDQQRVTMAFHLPKSIGLAGQKGEMGW